MTKIMDFNRMVEGFMDYYKSAILPKKNKKYNYFGYEIDSIEIQVIAGTIESQLSEKEVNWQLEANGHSHIEQLISAAITLGIQQGITLCSEKPETYLEKTKNKFWSFKK